MKSPGEDKATNHDQRSTMTIQSARLTLVLPVLCLVALLAACAPAPTPTISSSAVSSIVALTPTFTPSVTATPTLTQTILPSPTVILTPVTAIASPLHGIELSDLHTITSQEFSAPSVFMDDGHPAVDLAFFTFEDLPSMYGHPVQSVLPGKVVMVLEDRFPYGSMILIETPLEWLADELFPSSAIPTPIPDSNIEMFSPCANDPVYAGMAPVEMSSQSRSLYVLYSHLRDKPAYERGDWIAKGEVIGAVGLTGNTVAEHLHLEMRIGPSDAKFNSFAMYKPEATIEERYYYCSWSSSGRFQPIDPAQFWDR
jgi:hypothetical protein